MARIALILSSLPLGGTERLSLALARAWTGLGHHVEFAVLSNMGALSGRCATEFDVVDLHTSRLRCSLWPLIRYFRKSRAQVHLVQMWPLTSLAVLAWILAGRPGQLYLSDHTHLSTHWAAWRCVLGLSLSWTYPFASGVIAVSRGVKEDIQTLSSIGPSSIEVIYDAVPFDLPGPQIKAKVTSGHPKILLSIGRLVYSKDQKLLIEAFDIVRRHVAVELILIGEGPMRSVLEEEVRRRGLERLVCMPGLVMDPRPYFQRSDLFVLTSTHEGFGLVLAEAMAFGVSVVSTDCPGGVREILEDGKYGALVPVGNSKMLAHAIMESLNYPKDRILLWTRAQNFSIARVAVRYLEYFGLGK